METVVTVFDKSVVVSTCDNNDVVEIDGPLYLVEAACNEFRLVETDKCDFIAEHSQDSCDVTIEHTDQIVASEVVIGPRGPVGPPSGLVQLLVSGIAHGERRVIDQIDTGLFRSCKWIVTVFDSIAGLYKTHEVSAIHNNGTIKYTVYGIIGDTIICGLSVDIEGPSLVLILDNRHANTLGATIIRIPTINQV